MIGFFDRGRFVLGAVSGEPEVPKTREMSDLRERLEWVAAQENSVSADLYEDGWHATPEDARAQIVSFLEEHEENGFYALPLRDDQGTLGALALLAATPIFFPRITVKPWRSSQTRPPSQSATRSSINKCR